MIELLPALPTKWTTGIMSGLCARGGIEVSIEWKNHRLIKAKARTKINQTVKFMYDGEIQEYQLRAGEEMSIF